MRVARVPFLHHSLDRDCRAQLNPKLYVQLHFFFSFIFERRHPVHCKNSVSLLFWWGQELKTGSHSCITQDPLCCFSSFSCWMCNHIFAFKSCASILLMGFYGIRSGKSESSVLTTPGFFSLPTLHQKPFLCALSFEVIRSPHSSYFSAKNIS